MLTFVQAAWTVGALFAVDCILEVLIGPAMGWWDPLELRLVP